MGKSAFALNIATNAAVQAKVPVVIFNLEMSKSQLVNRILCSEAMVDSNKIRTGKIEEDDWVKLATALGPLSEAPIYIDDTPGITVTEIRAAENEKEKEKENIKLRTGSVLFCRLIGYKHTKGKGGRVLAPGPGNRIT